MNITKWVSLNYYNKYRPFPESNFSFVKKYIYLIENGNNFKFRSLALDKEFKGFYFANLDYFKLNYLVIKNNYILYLLNTTDNLILSFFFSK